MCPIFKGQESKKKRFFTFEDGPIGCLETSVNKYHYTLRNFFKRAQIPRVDWYIYSEVTQEMKLAKPLVAIRQSTSRFIPDNSKVVGTP